MPQNIMNGINAAENRVRSQNQRSWELTHNNSYNPQMIPTKNQNIPENGKAVQNTSHENPKNKSVFPEISQIGNFLSETDPEKLLMLMLIILLVKEGGDYILIAALIYILM